MNRQNRVEQRKPVGLLIPKQGREAVDDQEGVAGLVTDEQRRENGPPGSQRGQWLDRIAGTQQALDPAVLRGSARGSDEDGFADARLTGNHHHCAGGMFRKGREAPFNPCSLGGTANGFRRPAGIDCLVIAGQRTTRPPEIAHEPHALQGLRRRLIKVKRRLRAGLRDRVTEDVVRDPRETGSQNDHWAHDGELLSRRSASHAREHSTRGDSHPRIDRGGLERLAQFAGGPNRARAVVLMRLLKQAEHRHRCQSLVIEDDLIQLPIEALNAGLDQVHRLLRLGVVGRGLLDHDEENRDDPELGHPALLTRVDPGPHRCRNEARDLAVVRPREGLWQGGLFNRGWRHTTQQPMLAAFGALRELPTHLPSLC